MQKNPVGWFEIYVGDMDRARRFYETVFQVKLDKMPMDGSLDEMLAFPMEQGGMGAAGALVKMKDGPSGAGGTIVYFMSSDCAVEAKRAADCGGQIMKPKFAIGEHGFITLLVDSEKNVIGVHSMK